MGGLCAAQEPHQAKKGLSEREAWQMELHQQFLFLPLVSYHRDAILSGSSAHLTSEVESGGGVDLFVPRNYLVDRQLFSIPVGGNTGQESKPAIFALTSIGAVPQLSFVDERLGVTSMSSDQSGPSGGELMKALTSLNLGSEAAQRVQTSSIVR